MTAVMLEVLPEERGGRGRFWRPGGHGYTDVALEAGLWSWASVPRCDRAVPVDARAVLAVERARLEAQLAQVALLESLAEQIELKGMGPAQPPAASPWVTTRAGGAVDLLAPRPEQISAQDIAWALGGLPRFTAHTSKFYSVAEHCCHVSDWVMSRPMVRVDEGEWVLGETDDQPGTRRVSRFSRQQLALALWGLLHDAAEAYTGDISSPMKQALRILNPGASGSFKAIERGLNEAIFTALGVSGLVAIEEPEVIKRIDRRLLVDERSALLPRQSRTWSEAVEGQEPLGVVIGGWDREDARHQWLFRLDQLTRDLQSATRRERSRA
jgi:hypothetical protein